MSRKSFFLTLIGIIGILAAGPVLFSLMQTRSVRQNIGYSETSQVMPAVGIASRGEAGLAEGKMGAGNVAYDAVSSYMPMPPIAPTADVVRGGQLYLQDTSLSLVSADPVKTEADIRQITTELEGFLVASNTNRPEEGATSTITVRVPTAKLDEALQRFEAAGQRVISKSVQGHDVTQQYQDLQARLETLTTVEERLQALLEQTDEATALLQIQQQLFQIQDQKDALEGQRRYLEDAAATTRVTVYVASDEQALPYVPAQPWKPEAIFKQAVRSLVGSLRGVGTAVIWIAVYLPLAIPFILLGWWLWRRLR